jgi:hypothetical protein
VNSRPKPFFQWSANVPNIPRTSLFGLVPFFSLVSVKEGHLRVSDQVDQGNQFFELFSLGIAKPRGTAHSVT